MPLDGTKPTLLYGYGGFEISHARPATAPRIGRGWLERGGVYVLANIRGGGEFGPQWHQAALQGTSPARVRRLHRRGRGSDRAQGHVAHATSASWAAATAACWSARSCSRSGRISSARWSARCRCSTCGATTSCSRARRGWASTAIRTSRRNGSTSRKYSPYQNVQKASRYPRVLFTTSTRDDRVHPGHARKMVARMKEQGHDVLYYENIEGGHGAGRTRSSRR